MSSPGERLRRADEITAILGDPRKLADHLARALPPDVRSSIISMAELGFSGSITIHFHEGEAKSFDEQIRYRVGAVESGPRRVAPRDW